MTIIAALPLEPPIPPVVLGFNHACGLLRGLTVQQRITCQHNQALCTAASWRHDDLSYFPCTFFSGRISRPYSSKMTGQNYMFTIFEEDIGQSLALWKNVVGLRYVLRFKGDSSHKSLESKIEVKLQTSSPRKYYTMNWRHVWVIILEVQRSASDLVLPGSRWEVERLMDVMVKQEHR